MIIDFRIIYLKLELMIILILIMVGWVYLFVNKMFMILVLLDVGCKLCYV